jgi:hypothetical protein
VGFMVLKAIQREEVMEKHWDCKLMFKEEHPPDITDEFFSLGQSSRPLNLSGNLYRQKFRYGLFSVIWSSSSSERFT